MPIFDPQLMKAIIKITCSVLRDNFFYSDESIASFINTFTDDMANALDEFEAFAEESIINELHRDRLARFHFTCYFTSVNLRFIFINKMHFTEQELQAFENLLPKYIGEKRYEKQRHTRTDD
jgi:hypothetical protein